MLTQVAKSGYKIIYGGSLLAYEGRHPLAYEGAVDVSLYWERKDKRIRLICVEDGERNYKKPSKESGWWDEVELPIAAERRSPFLRILERFIK
ncbi:MAG: hypothetical protein QMD85_04215 [Candidatus Aenigmarchaeota archaeon]|nr:hypothetical protein [Candidatus Aenigmarchaeota archaeon]MDI6722768.1 hypothetical protein [Candidatus Aenigmarchaeota archaeon]